MTALSRQHRPPPPLPDQQRSVRIRWSIGPGALPGTPGPAALEWRLTDAGDGRVQGGPWLIRADDELPLACLTGLVAAWTDDPRGLEHIDIPGLLAATIARDPAGQARILYARTTLLAQWGVAGGRYEVAP